LRLRILQSFLKLNLTGLASVILDRDYEGLRLAYKVFPEETHMSVYPAALGLGLCEVFN
jgi:hypothetical protein